MVKWGRLEPEFREAGEEQITKDLVDFVQSAIRSHRKGRNKRSHAGFRTITSPAKSPVNCRKPTTGKPARRLFQKST